MTDGIDRDCAMAFQRVAHASQRLLECALRAADFDARRQTRARRWDGKPEDFAPADRAGRSEHVAIRIENPALLFDWDAAMPGAIVPLVQRRIRARLSTGFGMR